MARRFFLATASLVSMLFSQTMNAQEPQPPVAERKQTKLEIHGHTRIDNYFWLRNRDDEKVLDYLTAENEYLDAVMVETKPLETKLYQEIIARIKQDDSSVPYTENGYEYYIRYEEGQQYRLYCRRRDHAGASEEVMLDGNVLAKGHTFCSIAGVKVNRLNKLAAFAIDTVGRRIYTLRIKDLADGKMLEEEIPAMAGNFVWAEDGRTLFYTGQSYSKISSV